MTAGTSIQEGTAGSTVGSLVAEVRRRLWEAGIESADQEAAWLIEHALGVSGLKQIVGHDRVLSPVEETTVQRFVDRRAARVPLQYLLGTQEFCGLEFEVDPSVLIPRPETELLVKEISKRLPQGDRPIIVDVGTGSGCVAVSLARAIFHGSIFASDLSSAALATAKRNAKRHGVAQTITWLEGDLLAPLAGHGLEGQVAAIVSNPPYIAEAELPTLQPEVRLHEPRTALVAGTRGTELHERLLDEAIPYLKPGGLLVMELGLGQSAALRAKVKTIDSYRSAEVVFDEASIDRVLVVERAG